MKNSYISRKRVGKITCELIFINMVRNMKRMIKIIFCPQDLNLGKMGFNFCKEKLSI